jgi:hypothetical protein
MVKPTYQRNLSINEKDQKDEIEIKNNISQMTFVDMYRVGLETIIKQIRKELKK